MTEETNISALKGRRAGRALFLYFSGFLVGLAAQAAAQTVPPPSSNFAQAINYQPGAGDGSPSSVFLAHLNSDAYLDVVVANQSGSNGNGSVSVFHGNGDGTLQPPVTYDSGGTSAVSVYVIDVNGDGLLDIVVANQGPTTGDGSVGVLLGNSDGTFQPPVVYDSGGPGANSIVVADVNGDGLPDIVVANQGSTTGDGSVSVLMNDAGGVKGTFSQAVTYDSGGMDATAVALADVNRDGVPDILVANNCYPLASCPQQQGGVAVLLNDKYGNFGPPASYPVPGPATSIAVADVNGDGTLDLFVGVSTYGAGFLGGDGTGSFGAYQAIAGAQGQVISVAVKDVNRDGINDLLIGLGYCAGCDIGLGSGVTVFPGLGSGSYGSPVTYTTGGQLAGAIGLGDLNGDSRLDLVVPNQCDDGIIDTTCGGNIGILLNSVDILTTTLSASSNTALTGQSVTYTAVVTQLGNAPTGTVTFRDSTTVIASAVPLTSNPTGSYQAVFSTSYSTAGTHQISATYSLNPVSQISNILGENVLYPTALVLVSSSPTSGAGQGVTFTATLTSTSGAIPNGESVTFYDNGGLIGIGTTASGVATATTTTLSLGVHTIAAIYAGDATFSATSAQITQLVQTVVIPPSPTISIVTPSTGFQGQQGLPVAITGTNFLAGSTTATFGGSTAGITVATMTVNSPTSATAVLNIAPTTALASYDVVLSVAGATTSATLTAGFTVTTGFVPVNVSENITVTDTPFVAPPYTVTGIQAAVANYSAGSIGFVNVTTGQTVTQTLTLSNIGLLPLTVSAESIIQDSSNSFSFTQVQCSNPAISIPGTLPSGAECTLTFSYTAPASGTPGGSITFTDNAGLSNLTSSASGTTTFTQSLVLSSTVATTAAPSEPPTTITIPITEAITVTDSPLVLVAQPIVISPASLLPGVLNSPYPPVTFTATGGTGTLTLTETGTLPAGLSFNAGVLSGTPVAPSGGNTYSFSVSAMDSLGDSATQSYSIVIGETTQTITFGPAPSVLVGKTGTVTATGGASGNPVVFATTTPNLCSVNGNVVTGIAVGYCQVTANQAGSGTYLTAAQATQSVPIGSTQTITFSQYPANLAEGGSAALGATSSSTLAVTFGVASSSSSYCTVNGNTVTGVLFGPCVVTANQIGNGLYLPAPQVQQTVTIGFPQSVTFNQFPTTLGSGDSFTLAATASSGLAPVAFSASPSGICTVSGNVVTASGAPGTCNVTASQAGNSQFVPATAIKSFQVTLLGQTITFLQPAALLTGKAEALSASSSRGLPITFASLTPSTCAVNGSSVTGLAAGNCIIEATASSGLFGLIGQAQVTKAFLVGTTQTITIGAVTPTTIGVGNQGTFIVNASSGLAPGMGITTPGNCTIASLFPSGSGLQVTVQGVSGGNCVVTANQAGNATYLPAAQVTETIPIGVSQKITFSQYPPSLSAGDSALLIATASSGLAVTFSASPAATCGITAGNALFGYGTGTCTVVASQAGNAQYAPATPVTVTVPVVSQGGISWVGSISSLPVGGSANLIGLAKICVQGLGCGTLVRQFISLTPSTCTVSNSTTLNGIAVGSCEVAAIVPLTTINGITFGPWQRSMPSVVMVGTAQTITFAAPPPISVGGTETLSATGGGSGNPVVFGTTSPASLCTVTGNVVAGVGSGNCVVTANQAGNATYLPAAQVTEAIPIGVSQKITFSQYPPSLSAGDSALLIATASSGLAVTFSASPAATCGITAGNALFGYGTGTCTLVASQAGNAQYAPATSVTVTVPVVSQGGISWIGSISSLPVGGSASLIGLAKICVQGLGCGTLVRQFISLTPSTCTVSSGVTLNGIAVGSCEVAAVVPLTTINGITFGPWQRSMPSVVMVGTAQTITFAAPPPISVGGTETLSATGGASGNPVVFGTTSPASLCTVTGNVVAGVGSGNCVVTANQAGNATYLPAAQVTQTIPIGISQKITFSQYPPSLSVGDSALLIATASSGLAVTFSASPAATCGITAGNALFGYGTGTCTVVASQAGNAQYAPATPVTVTVPVVSQGGISWNGSISSLPVGGSASLIGLANICVQGLGCGMRVTQFISLTPSTCTVSSGVTLNGIAVGSCEVAAVVPLTTINGITFGPWQRSMPQVVMVGTAQTITFAPAPTVLVGGTGTLSATASSGLPVTFTSLTPSICTVNGNTVNGIGVGQCIVAADQSGNTKFLPAVEVTQTIGI